MAWQAEPTANPLEFFYRRPTQTYPSEIGFAFHGAGTDRNINHENTLRPSSGWAKGRKHENFFDKIDRMDRISPAVPKAMAEQAEN